MSWFGTFNYLMTVVLSSLILSYLWASMMLMR